MKSVFLLTVMNILMRLMNNKKFKSVSFLFCLRWNEYEIKDFEIIENFVKLLLEFFK